MNMSLEHTVGRTATHVSPSRPTSSLSSYPSSSIATITTTSVKFIDPAPGLHSIVVAGSSEFLVKSIVELEPFTEKQHSWKDSEVCLVHLEKRSKMKPGRNVVIYVGIRCFKVQVVEHSRRSSRPLVASAGGQRIVSDEPEPMHLESAIVDGTWISPKSPIRNDEERFERIPFNRSGYNVAPQDMEIPDLPSLVFTSITPTPNYTPPTRDNHRNNNSDTPSSTGSGSGFMKFQARSSVFWAPLESELPEASRVMVNDAAIITAPSVSSLPEPLPSPSRFNTKTYHLSHTLPSYVDLVATIDQLYSSSRNQNTIRAQVPSVSTTLPPLEESLRSGQHNVNGGCSTRNGLVAHGLQMSEQDSFDPPSSSTISPFHKSLLCQVKNAGYQFNLSTRQHESFVPFETRVAAAGNVQVPTSSEDPNSGGCRGFSKNIAKANSTLGIHCPTPARPMDKIYEYTGKSGLTAQTSKRSEIHESDSEYDQQQKYPSTSAHGVEFYPKYFQVDPITPESVCENAKKQYNVQESGYEALLEKENEKFQQNSHPKSRISATPRETERVRNFRYPKSPAWGPSGSSAHDSRKKDKGKARARP